MQNNQNKKDTFFSNPNFCFFGDFLKLKVFPEENPAHNLQIHWGCVEIGKKKFKVRLQICRFCPEIVKFFDVRRK